MNLLAAVDALRLEGNVTGAGADPTGQGVVAFDLLVRTPPIVISAMWRPNWP